MSGYFLVPPPQYLGFYSPIAMKISCQEVYQFLLCVTTLSLMSFPFVLYVAGRHKKVTLSLPKFAKIPFTLPSPPPFLFLILFSLL